jgi:hypothetical protein
VVVSETTILEAQDLARHTTTIPADTTGTAGLAGLIAMRPELSAEERVAVLFTGVRR